MKKFLSILMALLVLVSVAAFSASAADAAQTVLTLNKGDEVVYSLNLTVPQKVVGCDFSIYYDNSQLKIVEYADFTGDFNTDEHMAVINPNIKDELRGNWSILSGVRFEDRAVVTVKFEAVKACDAHISYYVRYLYPESMEQFTDYTFTCDAVVNKAPVIEDAAPELNIEEPQSTGKFVNSVTGKSEDADVNVAEQQYGNNNVASNNGGEVNENNVENNDDNNSTSSTTDKKDNKKEDKKDTDAEKSTTVEAETSASTTGGADEPETVAVSQGDGDSEKDGGIFTSVWFWIIIIIVLAGGGFGAYYYIKVKKPSDTIEDATEEPKTEE